MLLYTGWHEDIRRQTAEGCIPESRGGCEAAYILIAGGDTTTLGPKGPINLKNLLPPLYPPFKKINMPQNAVVWYT